MGGRCRRRQQSRPLGLASEGLGPAGPGFSGPRDTASGGGEPSGPGGPGPPAVAEAGRGGDSLRPGEALLAKLAGVGRRRGPGCPLRTCQGRAGLGPP